jgi:hypothetical protein
VWFPGILYPFQSAHHISDISGNMSLLTLSYSKTMLYCLIAQGFTFGLRSSDTAVCPPCPIKVGLKVESHPLVGLCPGTRSPGPKDCPYIPSAKPLFGPSATPDMLSLLLVASLLITRSLAAIFYDPTLVANKTYDFIIAGVSLLVSIPIPSSNVFSTWDRADLRALH